MQTTAAPLFTDISPGSDKGAAYWVSASDGVRLRIGIWSFEDAKGTVFLFPGRTEYIEKYGPAAADLGARGFSTIAIDWRGQGLADRFLEDRRIGHVGHFTDYQKDVAAMIRLARAQDLPQPWYLVGHSMGGCIALRAAIEEMPVNAVAFTGPMWGIRISTALQPVAWVLTRLMPRIGQGGRLAPTTVPEPYVIAAPFEDNQLTTDRDMHDMMRHQVTAQPDLCLGGPSYNWLGQALWECDALAEMPAPNLPAVTFLGSNERIVHTERVHERMENWPGARLELIDGAEHEVMMETPGRRARIFDDMAAFFHAAA